MGGLTFGHLPAATVPDALAELRDLLGCASHAIIRSLDSSHSERDLSRALSFHGVDFEVSFGNVCVSMGSLWKALEADVFTGFDEVWIFRNEFPSTTLESLTSATSDGADFSAGMPASLAGAMDRTDCVLVLGDGCGLNYATTEDQITERFRSNAAWSHA